MVAARHFQLCTSDLPKPVFRSVNQRATNSVSPISLVDDHPLPFLHYCNFSATIVTTELQNLQAQLRELNIRLADVKKDEKQAFLAGVQEHVALYGITEEELQRAAGFRKSRKPRAQAKYYDPSSGKTWCGFGRRPKWLEGKNLDDYLIERAAKQWWPGENT